MSIGDGRKTYSDSTLKSMTKDELIDIIRCLESNLRNAHDIECGFYSGDVKNLTRRVLMRVLD